MLRLTSRTGRLCRAVMRQARLTNSEAPIRQLLLTSGTLWCLFQSVTRPSARGQMWAHHRAQMKCQRRKITVKQQLILMWMTCAHYQKAKPFSSTGTMSQWLRRMIHLFHESNSCQRTRKIDVSIRWWANCSRVSGESSPLMTKSASVLLDRRILLPRSNPLSSNAQIAYLIVNLQQIWIGVCARAIRIETRRAKIMVAIDVAWATPSTTSTVIWIALLSQDRPSPSKMSTTCP